MKTKQSLRLSDHVKCLACLIQKAGVTHNQAIQNFCDGKNNQNGTPDCIFRLQIEAVKSVIWYSIDSLMMSVYARTG